MSCCQDWHWDTDHHLPALTSILQYMQPWAKMIRAAKGHWKLIHCLLSTYTSIWLQNYSFSVFFICEDKLACHKCFIPISLHYIKLLIVPNHLKVRSHILFYQFFLILECTRVHTWEGPHQALATLTSPFPSPPASQDPEHPCMPTMLFRLSQDLTRGHHMASSTEGH